MVGETQKKIAEEALVELFQQGSGLRFIAYAVDEILQLRLRPPLVGHERRLDQAVEEGVFQIRHGGSIGFLGRPECSRLGAGGKRNLKIPLRHERCLTQTRQSSRSLFSRASISTAPAACCPIQRSWMSLIGSGLR